MINRLSFFTPLLLASVLTLSACGEATTGESTSTSPAPSVEASPSAVVPSTAPQTPTAQSPNSSSTDGSVAYQEPSGLFQISFPQGYTYEETGSGVAFASSDEGFAGSVDFGSAQGQQLSNEDLETALKEEYEKRLQAVTWQKSEIQPDGSVRVDWVGTDPDGNELDAISFVEQRGDNIFILNLFGVNRAYQDYNNDAEVIVGSYRIRQ
jgi:ABC-type phosphate transport system substrate-binding protein